MEVVLLFAYITGGLLALVVGAVIILLGYIYNIRRQYRHLPSPKLHPSLKGYILGHLFYIMELQKATYDDNPAIELYKKWYMELECPTVFVIHFFCTTIVYPCHPETIKAVIMQVKNRKSKWFTDRVGWLFGERFEGISLVTLPDYDTWKPKRKIFNQPFNKSYLKSLLPSFNECIDKLLEDIRPLADGKTTVFIRQHTNKVTIDIISKAAFGSDFKEWDRKKLDLKGIKGGKLSSLVSDSMIGLEKCFNYGPAYKYFHPFEVKSYQEAVRGIRIIGRDCIIKRIRAVEAGEEVPRDILSAILQMASVKESVDIEELVDNFVAFYIGGQETIHCLLSISMVLVHQHPDILCRLQAEVEEVLEGRTEVTSEDLEKLQYTEQVLLETLRIYPIAVGVTKTAMEGGIQLGEYFIPGGALILLHTAMMSRLPQYIDDPDSFNPSRFNPENQRPSSYVYFPFGLGHRACIGQHFALMESKMVLARLVQTFRFTLPPDYKLQIVQRVSLKPNDDVPCTVIPAV